MPVYFGTPRYRLKIMHSGYYNDGVLKQVQHDGYEAERTTI
ncbi:hypothetical protein [Mucilaginibacter gilvus]|nr:hypothetical protein [Mucilaginibacter gilvus]